MRIILLLLAFGPHPAMFRGNSWLCVQDRFWQCSGDHMAFQGSHLDQPCVRFVPYSWAISPDSCLNIARIIFTLFLQINWLLIWVSSEADNYYYGSSLFSQFGSIFYLDD